MRATTIRFLDYWLGVPACAFLTGLRRLADLAGFGAAGSPQDHAKSCS